MNKTMIMNLLLGAGAIFLGQMAYDAYKKRAV